MDCNRARALLRYNSETGELFWRASGRRAGCVTSSGYSQIQIDRRLYLAHRIAWLITTGSWPLAEIDHINGDRLDNRLANLRDVCRSENIVNQLPRSGAQALGVHRRKDSGKWIAHIARAGVRLYLGQFETEQQAVAARLAAQRNLYPGINLRKLNSDRRT